MHLAGWGVRVVMDVGLRVIMMVATIGMVMAMMSRLILV
jgi:hypothetical protein